MKDLKIEIKMQKDEECLSECLFSVIKYYGINVIIDDIIFSISNNSDKLYDWEFKAGNFALNNGLKSTIYTNVSYLFDPSWHNLDNNKLLEKMKKEAKYFYKRAEEINKEPEQKNYIFPNKFIAERYKKEIDAAIGYVENNGNILFDPISKDLIKSLLNREVPVIVSINPALLHRMKRAYNFKPDDIRGSAWGHVIIISGYDGNDFIIADPGGDFYSGAFKYSMNMDRVVESILRYNGQMIVIEK
ncbi:MAG: C39 family peptidase [Candidatus Moraniibacteriota bacterium]